MSDAYYQFCQRKALEFAEREADRAELEAMKNRRRESEVRDDVVYKTYNPAEQPAQQQSNNAATDAQWNEWFSRGFSNHIDPILDSIVEAVDDRITSRAVKPLQAKIAKLQAEVKILRGIVGSDNVEMIPKRGRDVG